MMKTASRCFFHMVAQMRRDPMLLTVAAIPLLAGFAFRFGIPFAEIQLLSFFSREVLPPYYPLFDLLLLLFVPAMLNYVAAMIVLEERDAGLVSYLTVTPLGKKGYLLSRFGLTGLLSLLYSTALYGLFHLSKFSPWLLTLSLFSGTIQGVGSAMLIVVCSKNKVEGLAVGKFTSLFTLGALAPFLIDTNIQYLFSFLPGFWLAKTAAGEPPLLLAAAGLTALLWAVLPIRQFVRRLF